MLVGEEEGIGFVPNKDWVGAWPETERRVQACQEEKDLGDLKQKAAEKRVQCVLSDRIVLRTEQLISPQQVNGRINRKAKSQKATSGGALYVVN